jgi:hypothetical protein
VSIHASRRRGAFNASGAADEAADQMYESGELPHQADNTVRPEALVEHAKEEMAAYDPDDEEGWRHLARAMAFLEEAAAMRTPAYVDRDYPSADAEDDEDGDDETESARNPFTSSHDRVSRIVGRTIERQLGPLLRAAAARRPIAPAARAAGRPRPIAPGGKLSAVELAVCQRTGVSPEDYLKAKAQRGLLTS